MVSRDEPTNMMIDFFETQLQTSHMSLNVPLYLLGPTLLFCSFTTLFYYSSSTFFHNLSSLFCLSFIDKCTVCVMFAPALCLAISAFALGVHGSWEFYANGEHDGVIAYGRLDSILYPGQVSAHVHMHQGANAQSAT